MKQKCPICGIKHRKFPKGCYYQLHGDYVHVVIARVASNGNPCQKEFAKKTTHTWEIMKKYVGDNGWSQFG